MSVADTRYHPPTKGCDMLLFALLLGLITTAANILGAYLAILQHQPSGRAMANAIGFGGGFMVAAALMEMIPESLEGGAAMPFFIALGYLGIYLTEQMLNVHLHHIPHPEPEPGAPWRGEGPGAMAARTTLAVGGMGIATLVAFNVHDFIDGLAIGAAMVSSSGLGVLVFLAVLLHEVPAGFSIAAIMRGYGYSRRAAVLSGTSIGLITLLGIAIPFMAGEVNSSVAAGFLALSAGSFIYIGATILIPAVETGHSRQSIFYVALGFALFAASSRLVEAVAG